MTGEELKDARHKLGLTVDQFCQIFGIANERTLRGWEYGERNGLPAPVPRQLELLVLIALKFPAVRKWLEIGE